MLFRAETVFAVLAALVILLILTACGTNSPTPTLTKEQQIERDARHLCPSAYVDPCSTAYIAFANGNKRAALCVDAAGHWNFETPRGQIGDSCTTGGTIKAIVGGS